MKANQEIELLKIALKNKNPSFNDSDLDRLHFSHTYLYVGDKTTVIVTAKYGFDSANQTSTYI